MLRACRDPLLRIGMTSTWRCHFEQSEKSLHCCHEKREPLIMLSCRNPRGTNFVCASRDHLLPALSIPAAFVAALCRDDNEGEPMCLPKQHYTFYFSPSPLCGGPFWTPLTKSMLLALALQSANIFALRSLNRNIVKLKLISSKFGYTRHSINKFILCSHLHEHSSRRKHCSFAMATLITNKGSSLFVFALNNLGGPTLYINQLPITR